MKKIFLLAALTLALGAGAQEKEKVQAAKGVIYGAVKEGKDAVAPDELKDKLVDNQFDGLVKAKVGEVCQAEGCWMKLKNPEGQDIFVKFKDHAFLIPKDLAGHSAVVYGTAIRKTVSVEDQRHYAEDAGKTKEELAAITEPKVELRIDATGVVIE